MLTFLPVTSSALQPKIRSAARLNARTWPRWSMRITASTAASMTARSWCEGIWSAVWAGNCGNGLRTFRSSRRIRARPLPGTSGLKQPVNQPQQFIGIDGLAGDAQAFVAPQAGNRRGSVSGDQYGRIVDPKAISGGGDDFDTGVAIIEMIVGDDEFNVRILLQAQQRLFQSGRRSHPIRLALQEHAGGLAHAGIILDQQQMVKVPDAWRLDLPGVAYRANLVGCRRARRDLQS